MGSPLWRSPITNRCKRRLCEDGAWQELLVGSSNGGELSIPSDVIGSAHFSTATARPDPTDISPVWFTNAAIAILLAVLTMLTARFVALRYARANVRAGGPIDLSTPSPD